MFEILRYTFFQNALMGGLLASILCGLVGTYIVTRRLVFISGGITHASFGGVGLGVFLGINPIVSAMAFAIASACGVEWMSGKKTVREDSAIALFWTLGMSVGIICCFLTPGFMPDLPSFLFGNILTIGTSDLILLAILSLVVVVLFVLFDDTIMSVAFDPVFARTQNMPVKLIEYLMMTLIAMTIVATLRLVGIVRHQPSHHSSDDGKHLRQPFPPNGMAQCVFRRHILHCRSCRVVSSQRTIGSINNFRIYCGLWGVEERGEKKGVRALSYEESNESHIFFAASCGIHATLVVFHPEEHGGQPLVAFVQRTLQHIFQRKSGFHRGVVGKGDRTQGQLHRATASLSCIDKDKQGIGEAELRPRNNKSRKGNKTTQHKAPPRLGQETAQDRARHRMAKPPRIQSLHLEGMAAAWQVAVSERRV